LTTCEDLDITIWQEHSFEYPNNLLNLYRLPEFRSPSPAPFIFKQGEKDMGDKGKKDKGKREQQKKPQLSLKEKRKLKKDKRK